MHVNYYSFILFLKSKPQCAAILLRSTPHCFIVTHRHQRRLLLSSVITSPSLSSLVHLQPSSNVFVTSICIRHASSCASPNHPPCSSRLHDRPPHETLSQVVASLKHSSVSMSRSSFVSRTQAAHPFPSKSISSFRRAVHICLLPHRATCASLQLPKSIPFSRALTQFWFFSYLFW